VTLLDVSRGLRPSAASGAGTGHRRSRLTEALAGYAFTMPALVLFGVFLFVPLALTFVFSFQEYSGFGNAEWIGIRNYSDIVADPTFWRALLNTVVLTVFLVPITLFGGLALAMLLNKAMPGRTVLRALFYVPVVISGVSAGLIAGWMFNETFGVINRVAAALGLPEPAWQSGPVPAMASVIVVTVWTTIGYNMVVYLAALQAVPGELHEAARVDGATWWQQVRLVTWPVLRPTTFFLVIWGIITSFQVFDLVYVLTGGGPGNATTLLVTYAYNEGFAQRRQGYAAAIGVVLYAIVMVLTLVQFRLNRRAEH
jgi:multiple sugar transport system permease protein